MKDIQQLVLDYAADNDQSEEEYAWCEDNVSLIVDGDWIAEWKIKYRCKVYKVGEQFFEVTFSKDDCGYWGDGERYEPTICEVVPREVTKTIYVEKV